MDRSMINITRNIISKYNLNIKKRFGQNFLISDNVLNDIVENAEILDNEIVIEIGPGIGNLTSYLLKKTKHVIAVEIDKDMIDILKDRFKENNLTIINEDILKVDIDLIIKKYVKDNNLCFDFNTDRVKVVANLPYYITTPIIFKLLKNTFVINKIYVMVQKEVAKRIVAMPCNKDYSILSIMSQYISYPSILFEVNPQDFLPMPNVFSAVISFEKNSKYADLVLNEEVFTKVVSSSFACRRKKVINSWINSKMYSLSKLDYENILTNSSLDNSIRAEQIDILKYIEISNYIYVNFLKNE